jgi:hypothetical protein
MAIDPNEDLKQAEAILNGQMDERAATPAARQLALRIKNQPLRYPDRPDGKGPRPRGPLPRQTSSLSGGMVGAPSEPMSPGESMLVGDQRDAAITSKSLRDNGYTTNDPNDPRFNAEGRMYNRRENPYTQGDEAELDAQIFRENQNAGQASPSDRPGTVGRNDPNIAMGQITDENRQSQRNWNQFANADPGSEVQARYNPSGYEAYENRVTQNRQLANERERMARQEQLNLMSREDYEAQVQSAKESGQTRKDNIRNREVSLRTGKTLAEVAAMQTPAEKEDAMSDARNIEARGRAESYRRQARLGGGTVSGRTAQVDEMLQSMTPVARSRTLAQIMGGGPVGANAVEAAGAEQIIRALQGGGLGQGGGANNPLVQAQATGANQKNALAAQNQRVINENATIGDHYAPPSRWGHDAFERSEQQQAVKDLVGQGYLEADAINAVRRMVRERSWTGRQDSI